MASRAESTRRHVKAASMAGNADIMLGSNAENSAETNQEWRRHLNSIRPRAEAACEMARN